MSLILRAAARALTSLAAVAALVAGCAAQGSDVVPLGTAGTGGSGATDGSAGTGGGAASGGTGGSSGSSGSGAGGAAGASGGGSGGTAGAGAGGTSAGAAGTAGQEAGPDPCAGVVCNSPPPAACRDATTLRSYAPLGACLPDGTCAYVANLVTCPSGCANGACVGDPCLGVTCNAPPAPDCADASNLRVYQSVGVCQGSGQCSYPSSLSFCPFGCVNAVCGGDPCAGVLCNTPPAPSCRDASTLTVTLAPGVCGGSGTCSYPNTEDRYCAFGCDQGQCRNDPCSGVTCTAPPARNCKDATTARVYPSPGVCAGGVCTYPPTELPCPYGCVNGVCRDCQLDVHCGSGNWCSAGVCNPCNVATRCGITCSDCAASGRVCNNGDCVACVGDGNCGPGQYCSGNACVPCNTDQRCGATCSACGPGARCEGGACVPCNTDQRCGPGCAPCGGGTPYCRDQGAASTCVACRTSADCSGGNVCNATGACVPPCPSTLTTVFGDDFGSPSSSAWSTGFDAQLTSSRWRFFTAGSSFGVRINAGRLDITGARSGASHGQGHAWVRSGGLGSSFDNALFSPTLSANTGLSVVWSFNMRRDNPGTTSGGFSCSSPSSQNGVTVGLAYVLAATSGTGMNASTSTCSPSATASGYAVVLGGSQRVRLVRFVNGLRNGTLTDLVASGNVTVSSFLSVRVTYDQPTNRWQLEARSDGSSGFADPASGSYSFVGAAVDSTYVNQPLEYTGPYFQQGCTGICDTPYSSTFDNVRVGVRCAP